MPKNITASEILIQDRFTSLTREALEDWADSEDIEHGNVPFRVAGVQHIGSSVDISLSSGDVLNLPGDLELSVVR